MTSMSLSHPSYTGADFIRKIFYDRSSTFQIVNKFQNIIFKDESIEKYVKIEQFHQFCAMLHCAGTDC